MKALSDLIGDSPGLRAVRETVARLLTRQQDSRRLPSILIHGETGTGKSLLARMIHRAGTRPDGPFIDVNCAAIPDTLLEAEMFGFERGAFTDARRSKPGLFQAAHRGTIFLDEIGLLPEALQAKLLKVLEERTVRRLGATRDEPIDVWILTATNEDLRVAIRERRFREDLYHRLAVLTVALPPLRERGGDVLALAEHFLARVCADYGVPRRALAPDARHALGAYHWPGNVRELSNVLERAVLMSSSAEVTAQALALGDTPGAAVAPAPRVEGPVSLDDAMRAHLVEVLTRTGRNISRTAALLGISRNTLRARMDKYGLREGAGKEPPARRPAVKPRREQSESTPPVSPLVATPAASVAIARRWERRPVAFLRVALLPPAGPEASLETARALEVVVDKTRTFGGRIEGIGPIGLAAAFGLDAVGDAADRTAHAAMAIVKAIERMRRDERGETGVRLGLHIASVLVGAAGGTADLDMDERHDLWPVLDELVERAPLQSIVVTEAAAAFLRRRFELAAGLGPVAGREPTQTLVGRRRTGVGMGGRVNEFVGRHHELQLLESRLAAVRRGQGQLIGIAGDAGIGKSRLLDETRRRGQGEALTWLDGQCQSYGADIPYLPLLDLVRAQCGIGDNDEPDVITDKLARALREAGMDGATVTPYLLHLLGVKAGVDALGVLSPETIQVRIFDALRQLHVRRGRLSPLVIVIEDLHWMDKTSEAYVTSLADAVPGAPIMLVATYRPGYRPPWMERAWATQLALQPLAPEDSLSLAHAVLGPGHAAGRLAPLVVARSEGNPFFIEELARAAGEQGDLATPPVPETLQEVVLARIERLPGEAKRLLQAAAVLGLDVPLTLLERVWPVPTGHGPLLQLLTRQQFLYERSVEDETTYVFNHALTQEVAYGSLPPPDREALHTTAARALESLRADRLDEAADQLAHHYSRTSDHAKATDYLALTAERAVRRHAHREAVTSFRAARGHAERLPAGRARDARVLELLVREVTSLHLLGGLDEAVGLLLSFSGRVEQLGDPAQAGPYYFWLARGYSRLGDHQRAASNVRRAIDAARACKDDATLGRAYFLLGYEEYSSGRPHRAVEHAREAVLLLERTRDTWWLGMAHWIEAVSATLMGDFAGARAATTRAHGIGAAMEDPHLQNYAAWTSGWIDATRGEWETAIAACQRALQYSPDPVNTAFATGQLGYAYLECGDATRAIPLLGQAIVQLDELGVRPTQGRFLAWLSEACLAAGVVERAEALAAQSLEVNRTAGFPYGIALAERALGAAAGARGRFTEAEAHLAEALRMFESMQAAFEVARTRLSFADVAAAAGRREAVVEHAGEAERAFLALGAPPYATRARRLLEAAVTEPGPERP
ncbi:MAG TPA: sigma 54-interacting transcriptional regulator [Methylomirabilota bacterium]|nr:sigma 54-interacting transcriptional regulator [Methylomirabilota bacterium]